MVSGENNEYGDSKQIISCEYTGPEAKISFNYNLLLTPIKKIDCEYFKISYNGKEEFYSDMRSRFMMYGLSPETMTNLILAYKYIQRNQRLDYVDFS